MRGGELRPGSLIAGRYLIEAEIGAGAFGRVLRAVQQPLGTVVAIKVLLDSAALSDEARHRFFREARLAQRLTHPNTVRILDAGVTEQGRPFIVWEHLCGRTLAEHLAQVGKLSDEETRLIASQVLHGLIEAHGVGVVHRDIKPANLFITSHPGAPVFVKLLDFGVAKDLVPGLSSGPATTSLFTTPRREQAASAMLTRESQLLGTPRYMAPEQMGGGAIGPWSDLYALGLVMAEMVSGQPAFRAMGHIEVLLQRALSQATPLDPAVQASSLRDVIVKATALQPEDRYRSAEQMLADLTPRRPRPRRWLLAAFALAMVGIGVGITLLVLSRTAPPTKRSAAAASAPTSSAPPPSDVAPRQPSPASVIPDLNGAEMLRRAEKAGFVRDNMFRPAEFRNATAHSVTILIAKDGCSGTLQYFEQRDPGERATLVSGLQNQEQSTPLQLYVSGERVLLASMSRGKVRDQQCMTDAINAMLTP